MSTRGISELDVGFHLRVCAIPWIPSMRIEKDANGTTHYSGLNVELFDYLAKALHWTYSFVDVAGGDLEKRGPHGSCFHLQNLNKVDVSAVPTPLKPEFYKLMDVISSPLIVSDFRLIVPWPKEQKTSPLLATISPFQPTVWLCLLIVPFFIIMTMKILTKIFLHRPPMKNNPSLGRITFTRSVDILLNRGNWNSLLKKTSLRLIIGTWFLATLVLLNAYASVLTSFLTVTKLEPIANSLKELVDNFQPLKLLMIRNTPMEQRFLDATEGTFKKLGDSLRANPNSYVSNYPQAFQKAVLLKPSYALLAVEAQSYPFIKSTYKEAGMNCQFTISKILQELTATYHYYTSKHGTFTEPINKKWLILWDTGILHFWLLPQKPKIDQCIIDSNQAQKADVRSISLKELGGAFTILGLGISLSILVFTLERYWFAYRRFVNSLTR